jgi:lambda repressor-like predicted transcriptional regulator
MRKKRPPLTDGPLPVAAPSGLVTWEELAESDPVQFAYELREAIGQERIAVADLDMQAGWHRRELAELEKLADERGIPYPPRNEPPSTPKPRRGIRNERSAQRVDSYLKRRGLSRAGFAGAAGIGERTLRNLIQKGVAEHEVWRRVAKAMDVTLDDLLRLH